MQHLFDIVLNI